MSTAGPQVLTSTGRGAGRRCEATSAMGSCKLRLQVTRTPLCLSLSFLKFNFLK